MPQELQIIRASEFIRISVEGHFDLSASKAALAELASVCRKRGIAHAMLDLRAAPRAPKPVYILPISAQLVSTFREVGFTPQERLAVLYGSDPHRRARLFAFLSTMHGYAVRAFGEFEEALLWLSSGQETGPWAPTFIRERSRCPCDSRSARRRQPSGPHLHGQSDKH